MAGRSHPHSVQALLWLVAAWWLLLGLPASAVLSPPRAMRAPASETTYAEPEVVHVAAIVRLRIAVVGIWFGGTDAVAIARYALVVPPYMTTFPHDGAGNRAGDAKHSYTWGAYGDRPPHRFRKFNTFSARGDVVGQTKDDKTVTFETAYQADGRTAPGVTNPGSSPDRQRANTKEEDPTGLLNEGFRYRDLETGVFLTRDPAGFIDGPNLYCYVRQNPWSAFDPDGLAEELGDKPGDFTVYRNQDRSVVMTGRDAPTPTVNHIYNYKITGNEKHLSRAIQSTMPTDHTQLLAHASFQRSVYEVYGDPQIAAMLKMAPLVMFDSRGRMPLNSSIGTKYSQRINDVDEATPVSQQTVVRRSNAEAETITTSSGGQGATYVRPDYSKIPDPANAGPGKTFTPRQVKGFKEVNREVNGGVMRSDKTGEIIPDSSQSQKGVTPDPREVNVDHFRPRSKGGENRSSNAGLIERSENIKKSDKSP